MCYSATALHPRPIYCCSTSCFQLRSVAAGHLSYTFSSSSFAIVKRMEFSLEYNDGCCLHATAFNNALWCVCHSAAGRLPYRELLYTGTVFDKHVILHNACCRWPRCLFPEAGLIIFSIHRPADHQVRRHITIPIITSEEVRHILCKKHWAASILTAHHAVYQLPLLLAVFAGRSSARPCAGVLTSIKLVPTSPARAGGISAACRCSSHHPYAAPLSPDWSCAQSFSR